MFIYAISDIHGCIKEFNDALEYIDLKNNNTMLVLLGDYIHGQDSCTVLDRIIGLQETYGKNKIVALMGNHEEAVIENRAGICDGDRVINKISPKKRSTYISWMKKLPREFHTDRQIFCHAGIDEEAEDLWFVGTQQHIFTGKYPPTTGSFYMDIIAGHTGTSRISGDPNFHDVFFDGYSHYYIDGSTVESGILPVLMVDTEKQKYYKVNKNTLTEITG